MASSVSGKMNQTVHCDWLPTQARWGYLACSGLPAVSCEKNSLATHMNLYDQGCSVKMAGYWPCSLSGSSFQNEEYICLSLDNCFNPKIDNQNISLILTLPILENLYRESFITKG